MPVDRQLSEPLQTKPLEAAKRRYNNRCPWRYRAPHNHRYQPCPSVSKRVSQNLWFSRGCPDPITQINSTVM